MGIGAGLRRRLLVMLLIPLAVLSLLNAWFDYRSADNVALQQDQRLLALVPLLADSVIGEEIRLGEGPVLLLAPAVEEFLKERPGSAAFSIMDADGKALRGERWLAGLPPTTYNAEFRSEEMDGVTWRIVRQRVQSVVGEITVVLADGSDPRQQWARSIFLTVLLPNLILVAAGAVAVNWAVRLALRPLLELREAVERRSPDDLNSIDVQASPLEVRPLVESLNRLFDLVNAQAESQRRFVADAAHQLRTPLAGLQAQVEAWAQAVNQSPADTPARTLTLQAEQVNKLRNAARRTSQLANQLLALSRADARAVHAQPMQQVDLKALCETLLETNLDAAAERLMDLGLDAQPAQVQGYEWLLRELLSNLLNNAIKYTQTGGTITLRCGQRDEGAFLEVEDDGPGITRAERPLVLQRFYRVQGAQGEGNGLGLAIADEIARAHHARLTLDSGAQGRGLRVTLCFAAPVAG